MNKIVLLKKLIFTIYFVIVILFCLIFSGIIKLFSTCELYSNLLILRLKFFILFVVLPLIGWCLARYLRIDKSSRFLFYFFIPLLCFIFFSLYAHFNEKYIAKTSTSIVRVGEVKDIYWGSQYSYVDITYRKDGKRYKRNEVRFLGKSAVKTLHIGDSLLVLSVKDCDAIMYVYKPHPTLQEFKKCADYGYYFNGNLYSKEEFEGMKR